MEDSVTDSGDKLDIPYDKLCAQFREMEDTTQESRQLCERDRDYYDGHQLSEEELAALARRGQPAVVYNRIGPKIDALRGHADRMHADPKAYPRTPKHEKEAESVTDAIRFVCDENDFRSIRSESCDSLLIEGIAAATVTVKPDSGDIVISHVPWDRFYYDPASRRPDFEDASYMGVVLWMDESEAVEMFPGREDAINGAYTADMSSDTFDDRPRMLWSDRARKRIRVLQHRFKHRGEWCTAILCGGGYLRDPQVSPYVNEHGEPQCDLIARSAYIDRNNSRYGCVRRMVSPQDEINKRRSKALHLLSTTTIITEEGGVDNVERVRREVNRPDGVVMTRPNVRFEIERNGDLAMGQFNLLQEAKAEIDASGVNPALQGDATAPSGRAQEMMLQSGLAEMSKVLGGLRSWTWEIYRQVWYRVRQFWAEEKWVRVTDDENNLRWVAVNKPVPAWEAIAMQAEEQGQPIPPDELAMMQQDPQLQQVVRIDNQLGELDIDLILEDGPDSITIQSEQFEALVELKRADPASIPTRAIIEASSLRNKDQILEHLDSNGVPPQLAQQMQEMQQALQEAQSKLAEAEGNRELEMLKLQIDQYKAVTDRIKVIGQPRDIPDGWQGDATQPNVPDQGAIAVEQEVIQPVGPMVG